MSKVQHKEINSYKIILNIFFRSLGLIYFIFFATALPQIKGLIGIHGLSPVEHTLNIFRQIMPTDFFVQLLSQAQFTDGILFILFISGTLLSCALISGYQRTWILATLWLLMACLTKISFIFFNYPWDHFLLEIGFCSIWLNFFEAYADLGIWVIRILFFRLMFMMGYVKYTSTDSSWHDFSFLKYYFLTQLMPSPIAWLAYKLPIFFHRCLIYFLIIVELFVPFLIFMIGRIKNIGRYLFWTFFLLFTLIFITGNYGYFQFICMVACITLLEDKNISHIPLLDKIPKAKKLATSHEKNSPLSKIIFISGGITYLTLSAQWCVHMIVRPDEIALSDQEWLKKKSVLYIPKIFQRGLLLLNQFQISFPYDLFSHNFRERYELIIQGSNDGVNWKNYEFMYKPSSEKQIAYNFAPFQWRLDHHLFYITAFSEIPPQNINKPGNANLIKLSYFQLEKLLPGLVNGNKAIGNLLRTNPFSSNPPLIARSLVYRYSFSSLSEYRQSGNWWKSEFVRESERVYRNK